MKLSHHRIVSLREFKGWTQADLAERADIEPSYISKLERGKAPNVAGIILAKLATALETSVDYLLNLTDSPSPHFSPNHPALRDPDLLNLLDDWADLEPIDKYHLGHQIRTYARVRRRDRERGEDVTES